MTPAARLMAAIDVLAEIEQSERPADRLISHYFRHRRYAGAGDRRWVIERVYALLRQKGHLIWRLGRAGFDTSPRHLMLAALVGDGGLAPGDIAALFSGQPYGPAPLSAAERSLLAALAEPLDEAPPDWAVGNYPDWLDREVKRRFGAEWRAEMAAASARAALDLRANRLKTDRAKAAQALAADGFDARPTPYSSVGIRLSEPAPIERHRLYRSGALEVQDEGSQLVALLAGAEAGRQVVDYCAGAGGKTLALAAEMDNTGQIYAHDADSRRLDRLKSRMQRAGARNIQLRPPETGLDDLRGKADLVVVDAPCSGAGTWRRNPEQRWRLSPALLDRRTARQDEILSQAAQLVRPGGRLVYATCSFLPVENEDRIEAFVARHPDFAVESLRAPFVERTGKPWRWAGDFAMLTPAEEGTDAFFIAALARGG